MKKIISFLLIVFFISNALVSQVKFVKYTTEQGLVHNYVRCIFQDRFGFIWFGTKNGISRFDGINFKSWKQNQNKTCTVSTGWINHISCDKKNRIWIAISGTENNLMMYDYEKDCFTDKSSDIKKSLGVKGQLPILTSFVDNQGNIWLGAATDAICFNPEDNSVFTFRDTISAPHSKKHLHFNVRDIAEDDANNIWMATSLGVYVYNKTKKTFKRIVHDISNPLSLDSDNCNCILIDKNKDIWVGTFNGVSKVAFRNNGEHVLHAPGNIIPDVSKLRNKIIYDIEEDKKGNLLIATVNGFYIFNRSKGVLFEYLKNEIDPESVNSNIIRTTFCDKQGNIWIGTNAGVGMAQRKNFRTFTHSLLKNSISHNQVESLVEGPDSSVWIATPAGIDQYNKKTGLFKNVLKVTKNKYGLMGTPINLSLNNNKGIWIGTWGGGLSHYNFKTQKLTNFISDTSKQYIKDVFYTFEDSKKQLWVAGHSQGLYIFNQQTKSFRLFDPGVSGEGKLNSNQIPTIIEDKDSNIWVSSYRGVHKLIDQKKGIFKKYLFNVYVVNIYNSPENDIWAGGYNGLYKYSRDKDEFIKYGTNKDLPEGGMLAILEDKNKNLWISTEKGLISINDRDKKNETQVIKFKKEDGGAVGGYIANSCLKLFDGTMLFGGSEGFCSFHPDSIVVDTLTPEVVFTQLKVNNNIISPSQEINGQVILQKSIEFAKSLKLNHKNNQFSIEFAGLQYNMPNYNNYAYRLLGFDKQKNAWNYTDAFNKDIMYMNLPVGEYEFQVKASNSYGIWSSKISKLKVEILPPWWKTIWFRIVLLVFAILTIFGIIKLRTKRLQAQKQNLEKIVKQRTIELREMNEQLNERKNEMELQMEQMATMNNELQKKTVQVEDMAKQLHEADQSKLRFFSNISHEFRTPLALIIGPLEKMMDLSEFNIEKIKVYHQLMLRNSKRLYRLINQLIDFRKIEQHKKSLNLANLNITFFVKEVNSAFMAMAESKNIQLVVDDTDVKSPEKQKLISKFQFDPDIMEKVLYNLISNAIKYTPEGGKILITVGVVDAETLHVADPGNVGATSLQNTKLVIKISDTGIGINPENLNKIFDRFYRIDSKTTTPGEGTGIGLAYTKELVELHKGTIAVESKKKKGSTFTISFPFQYVNEIPDNAKDDFNEQPEIKLDYIHSKMKNINESDNIEDTASPVGNSSAQKKRNEDLPSVLIVEDNPDLRTFIKLELISYYNTIEAENGDVGLKLAMDKNPDLILSDIMMPGLNGLELSSQLKNNEDTCHIPIILLTAKTEEHDIINGIKTGADDYVTKPFKISILLAKIETLIRNRKMLRDSFTDLRPVIPSEIACSDIDEEFLKKAFKIVEQNIDNPEFTNDMFIELTQCSKSFVYKKLKSLTNQSVSEFIRIIRLKKAASILLKGDKRISEVCYLTGFKSPNHFSSYFTKFFGKTPRQFVKDNSK